jgi:hypothetical protein
MAHWERNYYGESQLKLKDVVFIEKGMVVECLDCPAFIQKHENPYSTRTGTLQITIGEQYQRQIKLETIRGHIVSAIEQTFEFFQIPFDKDLAFRYVRHEVPDFDELPFCVPEGLYVICDMKSHIRGQLVTCRTYKPSEDHPEFTVCFYQGIHHPTNIERLRVIVDPENFTG